MILEWTGDQPATGEVMPLLRDLVDRGTIRILDIRGAAAAEIEKAKQLLDGDAITRDEFDALMAKALA